MKKFFHKIFFLLPAFMVCFFLSLSSPAQEPVKKAEKSKKTQPVKMKAKKALQSSEKKADKGSEEEKNTSEEKKLSKTSSEKNAIPVKGQEVRDLNTGTPK